MSDDIKKQLQDMGLDTDGWQESPGGHHLPPMMKRQMALLEQAKALLEKQVTQDRAQVAELHETMNRVKHGGGS